jgi:ribosome biogenesis GTPase
MQITGRIIEEQKNYFVVATPSGIIFSTTIGALKKQRKKACTGDIVALTVIDPATQRGVITSIHPRRSYLKRPALANCSHLFCLSTFKEPPLNLEELDRLLVYAMIHDLEPCIVFNKLDTLSDDDLFELNRIKAVYDSIGHPVFLTSAITRSGIDDVLAHCSGRQSAFAGLSGVGKSTLLAAIFPDTDFKIGELSCSATRGMHTTTTITLLPLEGGGYIADTPGLAHIDLPAIPKENIVLYFNEIVRSTGKCRFNNCIHENEPGCIVIDEVKQGIIAPWRYAHYLKFRNEMILKRKKFR